MKAKKTATAKSKSIKDLSAKKNVKGGFIPNSALKKLELNPQPLPP
jgi:hypothetical protein